MAINSPFLIKLKDNPFPVNIKKLAIYGIGTNKLDERFNNTFFGIYYKNEPFLSGDGIVPRDSQIGYDIMSDYPNNARWVWQPDSINKTPANHFEELKVKQTVDSVFSFLDSTPPEFTLDSPRENTTTEINTNSISIKGKVYKEYLPADSEIIISGVRQENGAALNQINSPLKPSSLWIPNNPDSPVAEFDETLAFPGEGTYKISCQIKNPAGLTSGTKVFWIKVVLVQPNGNIIVHGYNPEGKEITGITGFANLVAVYDGSTRIGHAGNNSLTIPSGHHTINVKFNGMTLTQEIDINGGETQELTFTFTRTMIDIISMLNFSVSSSNNVPHPITPYNQAFYCDAPLPLAADSFLDMIPEVNHLDSMSISVTANISPRTSTFTDDVFVVLSGTQRHEYYLRTGIQIAENSISWASHTDFSKWFSQNNGVQPMLIIVLSEFHFDDFRVYPNPAIIIPKNGSFLANQQFNYLNVTGNLHAEIHTENPVMHISATHEQDMGAIGLKISSVPYAIEDL